MNKFEKLNVIIGAAFVLALLNSLAWCGSNYGTASAQFLKIGVGARAGGMGEAQAAVATDVNSIYWNPSGLNFVKNREVSFTHTAWFQDIYYENVCFAQKFGFGVLGGGISYLSMSPIEKYDNTGTKLNESFAPSDMAITLAYARMINDISFGATAKYIYSELESENAAAVAFDVGAGYSFFDDQLATGLVFQNMGSEMQFINESDPLPFNIKMGAGYVIAIKQQYPLLLALDFNFPADHDPRANFGVEYSHYFKDIIRLSPRIGYKTNTKGLEDGLSGVSFGFGFGYKNSLLDYAFAPYGELGQTHRVSVVLKF